jgi:hypothetical protein
VPGRNIAGPLDIAIQGFVRISRPARYLHELPRSGRRETIHDQIQAKMLSTKGDVRVNVGNELIALGRHRIAGF